MALPVVCVDTPSHESITSICSGGFLNAPPEPIEGATISEASRIDQLIYDINATADAAAATAVEKINELASLVPPTLPGISYRAPTWNTPPIHGVSAGALQITAPPMASNGVLWVPTPLNEVVEPVDSIGKPTTTLPEVPEAPPLDGAVTGPPVAPTPYDAGDTTAPAYTAPVAVMGTVDSPDLAEINIVVPQPLEIDVLEYSIDFGPIDDAIDRATSIAVPTGDIPDYDMLIPEVFAVVGGMLSGDAVDTSRILEDAARARAVAPKLTSRALHVPTHVGTYDDWLQRTMDAYSEDSATLFDSQRRDDVILAAYELATAAEELLVKIDLGMYDARFAYAVEVAKAQLATAKAVVASYNAEVARVEALIVSYNAAVAALEAQAQAVLTQAEIAVIMGDANKLVARQFTIEEEVKGSDVKVFRALVSSEAAKLTAYKAQIDAIDAKLSQAQVDMLDYTGRTAQYGAEVQNIKNIFASYSASSRAVSEENDMVKARLRGDTAGFKALATEASSSASRAAAEAMRKVRVSKSNEALYLSDSATNDVEGYAVANKQGEYAQAVSQLRADTASDSVAPEGVSDVGRAVSRFARIALESSGRAAALAQRANESLARAYASAYEAAGRASAAVSSGKLSGFRTSATLSARGGLNASRTNAEAYTSGGSTSYSETDTSSETISV